MLFKLEGYCNVNSLEVLKLILAAVKGPIVRLPKAAPVNPAAIRVVLLIKRFKPTV